MPRVAILDDYQQVALSMADWKPVTSFCTIHAFELHFGTIDEAVAALDGFEIVCLMRERMPFPRALIERLPSLKFLVVTGSHNRSLDLCAAREHGVIVSHTRAGGTEHATVELTWALILATARHLTCEDRALRAGRWQSTIGATLHGKTLGVLGLGRVGTLVAGIGRAFGMKVKAWSPNLTAERAITGNCDLVSKEDLFRQSDVLTVHMVLSEQTRGLVGAEELRQMQAHAILANTSRGPIIDESALIQALLEKQIGGAALDVFDQEPLPADHAFRKLDNVVLTPHLGYVSGESYKIFFGDMVENILAYLENAPIRLLHPAGSQ